jgi:hypothetical protein
VSDFDQRRDEVLLFRAGGSPAKSAAAWLSAIDRAEREGRACPGWGELEDLAPSLPSSDRQVAQEGETITT